MFNWFTMTAVLLLSSAAAFETREDARLIEMHEEGDYEGIIARFGNGKHVDDLSGVGLDLLADVLLEDAPALVVRALGAELNDDDLGGMMVAAVLGSGSSVEVPAKMANRLSRTTIGRVALAVNVGLVPTGVQHEVVDARNAVLWAFFFDGPGAEADEALRVLVELTASYFGEGRFDQVVPAPPAHIAADDFPTLALKLALLPYVPDPERFMARWSHHISRGGAF